MYLVQIVRDKTTGISMGFGFVNFEENESAASAIDALNGRKLREGKVMKVSIARPAWKANIHSNLYLSGFHSSLSEGDVMDLLGIHAKNAENVRLLRDSEKKLRGAAVVRMSSEEAASMVISSLNGVPLKSDIGLSTLQVKAWRPEFRAERVSDSSISESINSTKGNKVRELRNVHFGDAQALLQRMSFHHHARASQLPPPTVTPETIQTDDEDENLATLFIFHLPPDISEDFLGIMFSQFGGEIESLRILPQKGYGFISYFRPIDAFMAMTHLNGYLFPGSHRPIKIELKQ
jgi:ELAV like protein 2/3/4